MRYGGENEMEACKMRNLALPELINRVAWLENTKIDLLVDSTTLTMETEEKNAVFKKGW